MPLEFGLWRVDQGIQRLSPQIMPSEQELETLIESDSTVLGQNLLIVGRQVHTTWGKIIDLLAIDESGSIVLIELKRDKTPRDVVAQIIDYASWADDLGATGLREVWAESHSEELDVAFGRKFGGAVPDDLGEEVSLVIVASSIDPSTERIVSYLNRKHGVPLNVVFFQYFEDEGHRYLARTWLVDESPESPASPRKQRVSQAWNGRDWYVSFGDDETQKGRAWEDARDFGFVSAGGGAWYSGTLKNLPVGARVFVCVPGKGYVGVGTTTGPAVPADSGTLEVGGVTKSFRELPLRRDYHKGEDPTNGEWIVPVEWERTRPVSEAFWKLGMFANQNSACKLRNQFTLDELTQEFELEA